MDPTWEQMSSTIVVVPSQYNNCVLGLDLSYVIFMKVCIKFVSYDGQIIKEIRTKRQNEIYR